MIPEKWSIKRTLKTDKVITSWFNKNVQPYHSLYEHNQKYPYMNFTERREVCSASDVQEGYTEISYEYFIKYIVNKHIEVQFNHEL